ncbi:MAG: hypothetical protein AMXMBFR84_06870 [Candidatus Hydrogenedentota bacterium]
MRELLMGSIHYFKADAVLTLQALEDALADLHDEMERASKPGEDMDLSRLRGISRSLQVVQKRLRVLTEAVEVHRLPG